MGEYRRRPINVDRWLSVLAIAVGLGALFLSWQANQIAREANTIAGEASAPAIRVLDSPDISATLRFKGCSIKAGRNYYMIYRYGLADLVIGNSGGRATSLIAIDFIADGVMFRYVRLFLRTANGYMADDPSHLPIVLQPGDALYGYIESFDDSPWIENRDEAFSQLESLDDPDSKVSLTLHFSDNTSLPYVIEDTTHEIETMDIAEMDTVCSR